MLYYDHETRRQLSRERAGELAREYRRAQKGSAAQSAGAGRGSAIGLASILGRLRRERPERAPAYRS